MKGALGHAREDAAPVKTSMRSVARKVSVTPKVSCGSCASTFTELAWLALPLAEVLTAAAVSAFTVSWPPMRVIEVRRCSRCGRSIARSTSQPPLPPTGEEDTEDEPATKRYGQCEG